MTTSRGLVALAMVGALSLVADAQASSIGLQFYGAPATSVGTPLPPDQAAGVVPVSQANWNTYTTSASGNNGVTNTFSSNVDSTGSASGLTAVLYAANGAKSGNSNTYTDVGAQDLFSGFVSATPGNGGYVEVTLSNIPYAASGYDVYVYANRSSVVAETIGINTSGTDGSYSAGNSVSFTSTTTGTTYVQGVNGTVGANYVLFSGLSSGTLNVFADPGAGGLAFISGIELVAVPEPASLGIFSIAAVGLLARRRRR